MICDLVRHRDKWQTELRQLISASRHVRAPLSIKTLFAATALIQHSVDFSRRWVAGRYVWVHLRTEIRSKETERKGNISYIALL